MCHNSILCWTTTYPPAQLSYLPLSVLLFNHFSSLFIYFQVILFTCNIYPSLTPHPLARPLTHKNLYKYPFTPDTKTEASPTTSHTNTYLHKTINPNTDQLLCHYYYLSRFLLLVSCFYCRKNKAMVAIKHHLYLYFRVVFSFFLNEFSM